MAGYGNRTAPDISPSSLSHDHASTRLGLTDAHDVRFPEQNRIPRQLTLSQPPTYAAGAGLGNKLSHSSTTSSSPSHNSNSTPADDATDAPLRFDTQARHGSAPYSNAHVYGSASTAGAGWGNKTGSFSDEGTHTGTYKILQLECVVILGEGI